MDEKRPTVTIRDGSIAASLWERNGKKGRYLEFTLSRSYRAGEAFKYSTTFHERDAETLKRVIDRAAEGIRELSKMDGEEKPETAEADPGVGADVAPAATGPSDATEAKAEPEADNVGNG